MTWLWLGGGLALALLAVWLLSGGNSSIRREPQLPPTVNRQVSDKPAEPSAAPASRSLNAAPGVEYIGFEACAKCHPDQHRSYLETAHSRALGPVDLAAEPPDVKFDHEPSGRTYEVLRQGGRMIHRETLPGPEGEEPLVDEHAMRYAIGSGHHSRSYLSEIDGFLFESPITWYAAGSKWSMSPGYDRPAHSGFERVVDVGCLYCHAGRVEPAAGSRFRVAIHEATIGCESCHGPGSLHVQKHAGKLAVGGADEEDLTIVHPDRLTREESESICSQCHLRGGAATHLRGRKLLDYRPGMRLSDFHVDFVPEEPTTQMKVVGHVDQMRASACYLGSDSLTCITCHDPHDRPPQDQQLAYYRGKCFECHDSGCKLAESERLQRSAQDDCIACHMPQRPTDLAHFAFTHHRIGLHVENPPEAGDENRLVTLVPLSDISALPEADRERLYGLAYLEFADNHGRQKDWSTYRRRSLQHLQAARDGGAADAQVHAGLAQIAWERGQFAAAIDAARKALALPDFDSGSHVSARFVLSDSFVRLKDHASAQSALEKLMTDRWSAEHWVILAACRDQAGDAKQELAALLKAEKASPFNADIHALLAAQFRAQGDSDQAEHHQRWADRLRASSGSSQSGSERPPAEGGDAVP
jgi:tetratricopeptide (TPR) repeat protein